MNVLRIAGRGVLLAALLNFTLGVTSAEAQSAPRSAVPRLVPDEIRIVELQGQVEVSPAGATTWVLTQTNQVLHPFDRLRTGTNSRVALRWSDKSVVPFDASTEIEILPPNQPDAQSGLHLVRGIISFFHRDQPGRIRIITRGAVAGVEGTEFVLAVDGDQDQRTTLSVIDGKVRFGNDQATLLLTNGQQAMVEVGQAPTSTDGFIANNILQWCFYYPAVLDLADLQFTPEEENRLQKTLAAYRSGDLLSALALYPADGPGSDSERLYYAALLLSVGQSEKAEGILSSLSAHPATDRPERLARALRQLISAVKRQPNPGNPHPVLASELLANSYYQQSRAIPGVSLESALAAAKQAAGVSPQFGFAWARVAELEFCFGHTRQAEATLNRSLQLTPHNPQALALQGFLLAAQNRTHDAIAWFNQALAVDSSLANAWLGRGLSRIRCGDRKAGREDLLIAAALEPQRSELRSYLAKAYASTGDFSHARKELRLAQKLDPNDPTPWLYSALLDQNVNRINAAIADLEKSEELNDNRSVYRSHLLLDEDRAVRSADLAKIYRDAGMSEVSVREAARAVNADYANYSAHLFLAGSYNQLANPNGANLRYETPTESEYLLANLLAPVNAGIMSSTISEQEYSRFFERDRLGVVSGTEYLSRGAWTQWGAQYGIYENYSYDVEGFYRSDPGQYANNDIEQRQISLTLKQQVTPDDSVYFHVKDYEAESGDLGQYYDPRMASRFVRVSEKQDPIVGLGYHHEWSPGVHTLFFVTRLEDRLSFTNPAQNTLVAFMPDASPGVPELSSVWDITMHERLENRLEIYSGELQQIWQQESHNTVVGGRFQYGHFDSGNLQNGPSSIAFVFPPPPANAAEQNLSALFKRISVYGYHDWQIVEPLQLIGGLAYDHLTFPENFQTAPVSSREKTTDKVSPKAGFIWTPLKEATVRFAYTRSMGGASLDQSYQLEPSQVAGFVQSFRSIIPESVAGANAGAEFETYDLSLDLKLPTRTYLGIAGELLNSTVNRTVGTFDVLPDELDFAVPAGLHEHLDFQEQSLLFSANQLAGKEWSFGTSYRLSRAVLHDNFVDVPNGLIFQNFQPRQRLEGVLHHLSLFAVYNHPCGVFAKGDADWYAQNNKGYALSEPGDNFWQLNAFAGYRFPGRKAEVQLGVLNITDQDYKLNPLNLYNDLPRRRTLAAQLRLNF